MRPGHFFASCEKAMTDLDWAPEYNTVDGLRDSYENDFVHKKVGGAGDVIFLPFVLYFGWGMHMREAISSCSSFECGVCLVRFSPHRSKPL